MEFVILIVENISDLLNGSRGALRTLVDPTEPKADARRLSELQHELVALYNDLPSDLTWTASNFKAFVERKTAGVGVPRFFSST